MIYITGDLHADHDLSKIKNMFRNKTLTKKDYLIICGDFGAIWTSSDFLNGNDTLKYLESLKPMTVLFCDGNHENFNILDMIDEEHSINIFESTVGKIRDNIFHLKRGNIYNIDGKNILAFGGAFSIDKIYRKEGSSWWAREIPSNQEFNNAIENIQKCNGNIDIVITHTCPNNISDYINKLMDRFCLFSKFENTYYKDITGDYLNEIANEINKTNNKNIDWFFGHFHTDDLNGYKQDKITYYELYQDFIQIKNI